MTGLGLHSGELPSGEVSGSFRKGWLRHFKLALSSAGGAAAVLAVFELLQKQPVEGFKLLAAWGPWPIIAMVALVLVGGFFSRLNDTIQTTFGAIVTSVERQAESGSKTADALSRLADQNGKQAQEVQRLAIYAAQEFPGVYERFDRQDKAIEDQNEVLRDLTRSTNALHALLNQGLVERTKSLGGAIG